MYKSSDSFLLGALDVSPILGRIQIGATMQKVEPRVMDVLSALAARPGETVLRHELLSIVWADDEVSDESLTRAVSVLRKTLRVLDPKTSYIETIPKRGYRLIPIDVRPLSPPSARSEVDALVLQARSLNQRPFHTDVLPTALSLLKAAIELDPSHAAAHAELGRTYSLMGTYLPDSDKDALTRKAAACARHALAIDPSLGFPMTLIALEDFASGDILGALRLSEQAYAIAPEDAEVVLRLGYFFAAIGLTQRAIPLLEKAVALDPIQGRNYQILSKARLANGDLEEADRLAQRAIDLQHHFASENHAAIAFAMGKYELAGERLMRSRTFLADFLGDKFIDPSVWAKIVAQAYSPDQTERETLGRWITSYLFVPGQPAAVSLTQTIARTGPADVFFQIMGDTPPPGTHGTFLSLWGQTDTARSIQHHMGFMAFAKRMGMTAAWEAYGAPDCFA